MALPQLLISLLLLPFPFSSAAGNILLSGNSLPTGGRLSNSNAFFSIQDDCNLALIHNRNLRFQSNTRLLGTNCTLALTQRGQLLLQTSEGSTVWSTPPSEKIGHYAALLRPDGHVTVYGPSIWSMTPSLAATKPAVNAGEVEISPTARNIMFSSQVLDDSSKLGSGEHVLSMTDDCNLELARATEGVVWESGTKGMGRNCFARLDHRGQIAVVNDQLKVVWSSKGADSGGVYALVVRYDGQATVYGPAIWSTDS